MSGWNTVVQAETLAVALDRADLVVLDCRHTVIDSGAGELAFQRGHVPGAHYVHLERDLSDMTKGGDGRHPWPQASVFTAKLTTWGITPKHQVVAYDDDTGAIAARLWFMLRLLGHEKVAVLDGGWSRWTALGLPVDTHYRPVAPASVQYVADFDHARLLDADAVQMRLAAGELLLDARAADRFRGENELLDRIAGHVPGATSRPFAQNMADGRLKPPMQLADEYRALLGERTPAQAIAMCGSGVTACHILLAMERAGLRGGRLYTGSWSGWISDPSRPIATGEG
jgi:thiosulfate/3-mercaptopyruvate sulfurtransferase